MIFSSIAAVRLAASGFRTNQGVETSHANPNRLNQWYQTAWFPRAFKGGPQDSRRKPEKRTRATLKNTRYLIDFQRIHRYDGYRKLSECLPCGKNRENTDRRASMGANGARRYF